MLHLLMTNKAFINFRPCVLHEMKAGAMGSVAGLRFAPSLLNFMNSGAEFRAEGININPMLLYVHNMGGEKRVAVRERGGARAVWCRPLFTLLQPTFSRRA